ncbi:hypothetical protein DPMN_017181 [Dreissena polymorpha]|uniref:Uncharacterized protein n=1 Tax=Dreissena polymorpha TaxID=45954 RepID=A0A9D4S7W6_DREPO|nr:hypothetical protein DPMN_017181 [Dreissena polymorpha]
MPSTEPFCKFTLDAGPFHIERGPISDWKRAHFTLDADPFHIRRGPVSHWTRAHAALVSRYSSLGTRVHVLLDAGPIYIGRGPISHMTRAHVALVPRYTAIVHIWPLWAYKMGPRWGILTETTLAFM